MAKDKKSSFVMTALRLISIAPLFYRVANNALMLLEREVDQAKKNITKLVLLFLLFTVVCVSTWLSLLSMLCVYLVSLNLSWIFSLSVIFCLNFLLLLVTGLVILNKRHELFFPECRRLFSNLKRSG